MTPVDPGESSSARQPLLFEREKFYVHAIGIKRDEIEAYIKEKAGGRIVDRFSSVFIITPYQLAYSRPYAESLPGSEGEKVISLDWIKDSIQGGKIISRERYWVIPRAELRIDKTQHVSQSNSQIRDSRYDSKSTTGANTMEPNSYPGETSSRNHYRITQNPPSRLRGQPPLSDLMQTDPTVATSMLEQLSAKVNDAIEAAKRREISQKTTSSTTNSMSRDANRYPTPISPTRISQQAVLRQPQPGMKGHDQVDYLLGNGETSLSPNISSEFLRGKTFWLIGPPRGRDRLTTIIHRMGGNLVAHLCHADIVIFCRTDNPRFIISRIQDYWRAVEAGCKILSESWIHDLNISRQLVPQEIHSIRDPKVLQSSKLWDEVLPWTALVNGRYVEEAKAFKNEKGEPRLDQKGSLQTSKPCYVPRTQIVTSEPTCLEGLSHPSTSDRLGLRAKQPEPLVISGSIADNTGSGLSIQPESERKISCIENQPSKATEQEEEEDLYEDLAGIFSSDDGAESEEDAIISNSSLKGAAKPDDITEKKTKMAEPMITGTQDASPFLIPVKRPQDRPLGSFKKIRRHSDAKQIKPIKKAEEEEEEEDDDVPLRLKRKSSMMAKGSSLVYDHESNTNEKEDSDWEEDNCRLTKRKSPNKVLAKDKIRYDRLLRELSLRVKNNDFPNGLRNFLRSREGDTYLYKKYCSVYREALPGLPVGRFQKRKTA
ncbi:uncharacterized protein I206_106279 [Kwoniella pini CBS 10737]|uniref:BRCT domain-containing protein n=1 Tax=Kwoniella pini CBS 10737 TaxID=1296096 RepID=A0A1B9I1J7_9TREE|nr:uncharacterized protein I206_05105 [Kwoniella pini CBS 10737]OCF49412.1 hypothetical protein I206_05105 [Kwoniella pini CBS 10737]